MAAAGAIANMVVGVTSDVAGAIHGLGSVQTKLTDLERSAGGVANGLAGAAGALGTLVTGAAVASVGALAVPALLTHQHLLAADTAARAYLQTRRYVTTR